MPANDRAPLRRIRERLAPLYHDVVDRALEPVVRRQIRIEANQRRLARELQAQRAAAAVATRRPIRVALLCHEPAFWGKLAPVHRSLADDTRFEPVVVAMAYRHPTFGDDTWHDTGVAATLRDEHGIEPVVAYDAATDTWTAPADLRPDYVIYPTPYDKQYPPAWQAAAAVMSATTCYVPYYGTLIYTGEVADITHPPGFFDHIDLAFVPDDAETARIDAVRARPRSSSGSGSAGDLDAAPIDTIVTGAPMYDPLTDGHDPSAAVWNFPDDPRAAGADRDGDDDDGNGTDADRTHTRILWTPRWRVGEGTSHLVDYHTHLLDFARTHPQVDLVFRPHPLTWDQLVNNVGWPRSRVDALMAEWAATPNARIDESGDYVDTFLTADVLVSDISSMLVEYAATAKPVIYTHRRNDFNDLGNRLAAGFTWVRTATELDAALEAVIAGKDPLAQRRRDLATGLLGIGDIPASRRIIEALATHHAHLAGAP